MGSQPDATDNLDKVVSTFGHDLKSHFLMDPDYRNLNHGTLLISLIFHSKPSK